MDQGETSKEQELTAPRDRFFELAGRGPNGSALRMHVLDWDGAGLPLVLLHGLSSNAHIWDLMAPSLARSFRVVTVDQRGHGQSDSPDTSYSFVKTCGDLEALLRELALDGPVLVGHSWGASVALQYAADHPEGVGGLVLVDGGVVEIAAMMTWEQAEKVMRPPDIDGIDVERFLQFARNWPHVRDSWSPVLERMILSNFLVKDGKVYRRLSIENHMKVVRAIYDQKPTQLYPRVICPVLIIPAIREAANEEESVWQKTREGGLEEAMRLFPNARLRPIEDTVHDIPIHKPGELAEVIAEFARGPA